MFPLFFQLSVFVRFCFQIIGINYNYVEIKDTNALAIDLFVVNDHSNKLILSHIFGRKLNEQFSLENPFN